MLPRPPFWLLAALIFGSPALADTAPEPLDRGRLSLAWDAHESGLCEEVLRYVEDMTPGSASLDEGLWLKADCLRSLGRHGEAVSLLESPLGRTARDWRNLLREVYEDWVWAATEQESYAEALAVAERGLSVLPGEASLVASRSAASLRLDLQGALRVTLPASGIRLPGGEEVTVRLGTSSPEGKGWIRAYPWDAGTPWVPEITLEDWMPSLAKRLNDKAAALWVRIPRAVLDRALGDEAKRQGLTLRSDGEGWVFSEGGDETSRDRREWAFFAAAEGLGAKGAAASAAASAASTLRGRRAMSRWVEENRGPLSVTRAGPLFRLRHPETGRSYDLDPDAWTAGYDLQSAEWREFWGDLVAELGRTACAFRCFCGRDAVLRETLVVDAGEAAVLEKGRGYAAILTALCPLHQQIVTPGLLKSWGVDLRQARDRARGDAVAKTWDLSFERGDEGGAPYVALQGDGASSLARRPDLLLGALEEVEGAAVRGTSVQVVAPTASSVVIVSDQLPAGKALAAANRVLLHGARRGDALDRLGFRATLRLPLKASGVFEVHSAEGP